METILQAIPREVAFLAEAAPASGPGVGWMMGVLVASIALLLVLILVVRLQAFAALVLTSMFMALCSGMPWDKVPDTLVKGMGESLGLLATIVGLGAIFGQVLEYSGGAQSLARGVHRVFGEKRAPMAMILVGFLISIPVFFDVALVILAPILVAMAKASGKSILRYGLPLCAAMAVTHACIPPTPGPILVAQNLGVDLGQMILWGTVIGFPTAVVAGLVAARMGDRLVVPLPKIFAEAPEPAPGSDTRPVPAWEVVALIVLPILLILLQSVVSADLKGELRDFAASASAAPGAALPAFDKIGADGTALGWVRAVIFLGHPISALMLTTLVTLYLLGTLRGVDRNTLMDLSTQALGPAGIIILVTGAGGVFKTVLVDSGVGTALAEVFQGLDAPLILLAFLLTVIIRVTQGSATVAMIGGSALMAPSFQAALQAGNLSQADVALAGVAIACGATMLSHVNDSGFWVVKNYLGMTERQCLGTFTVITSVIGLTGFVLAALGSLVF
jgi:Gnt-I system low-affinity gluconate transporter